MKQTIAGMVRRAHISWLRRRARRSRPLELPEGTVAIIAPHPDDETIGCGGLIKRLTAAGRMPHIIILTGGEASHAACCATAADAIIDARSKLTDRSAAILGVSPDHIHRLRFPDGRVSAADSEAERLRQLLQALSPSAVLVPHSGEGWNDHVCAGPMVRAIAPAHTCVVEYCVWMWYYNVWRGLDWQAARSLRLTPAEMAAKQAAVDAYTLPAAPCGTPWSGNLPQQFLAAHRSPVELYFMPAISHVPEQ